LTTQKASAILRGLERNTVSLAHARQTKQARKQPERTALIAISETAPGRFRAHLRLPGFVFPPRSSLHLHNQLETAIRVGSRELGAGASLASSITRRV
jgi:hypothetical protein